jgi:signal transduction histidine kinase
MESLTIFWTALSRNDVNALEEAVRDRDAVLAQVNVSVLPIHVVPALATGAVIVVCGSNKEATLALAAGADEVLRSGEVTRDLLDPAIDRALARAQARALRNSRRTALEEEDDVALAMLRAALSDAVAAPLSSAESEADRLSQSLPAVLAAEDDFLAWTSSTDRETPRRIAARRLAAPSSEELCTGMSRLQEALRQARATVEGVLRLSRSGDLRVSASDVVCEVVDLIGGAVSYADVSVETAGPCVCAATRGVLVLAVTALTARALEAIRARGEPRGRVAIRTFAEEGTVVIEVQDDGEQIRADMRPDVFDPYFRDPAHARTGLMGVRDRVRAAGGEMVIDSGPDGTLVRVMFPIEGESSVRDLSPDTPARARKTSID